MNDVNSSSSRNGTKERSLSEQEKMEKLVGLCQQLEAISLELKKRGYDTKEVPTWYYSHCKRVVNYIEGFSRESNVRPSKLNAIRFKRGKRTAVVTKKRNRKD